MNDHENSASCTDTLLVRYEQLQRLLPERLDPLLAALSPLLRKDVAQALSAEGKLLAPLSSSPVISHQKQGASLPNGHWGLLTTLIALHVTPSIDQTLAASAGVATECIVCAIDLFDDVMDGDNTSTLLKLGIPRTVNVAMVLFSLAEQALLVSESTHETRELLTTLLEGSNQVALGQHEDLLAEKCSFAEFTFDRCLEIARNKGGGLMRLAGQLGAKCAGANAPLYALITDMAELFGTIQQLDNDAHDLYDMIHQLDGSPALKTDLARNKKTLPLVLAHDRSISLPETPFSCAVGEEREIWLSALHEGILATRNICLLYRERMRDRLGEIEALTQRPCEAALLRLLGL
jgi:geranylgeranyl pyrophosphate synthase